MTNDLSNGGLNSWCQLYVSGAGLVVCLGFVFCFVLFPFLLLFIIHVGSSFKRVQKTQHCKEPSENQVNSQLVCVCVCVCVCMHVYVYYMCVHIYVCLSCVLVICVYVCVCICVMSIYVCVCMHCVCMFACVHSCTSMCMCLHVFRCMW